MLRLRQLLKRKKNLVLIFGGVIGVVMVWRGLWGLIDLYLFPHHPEISYGISVIIGLIILLADDFELEELGAHRATTTKHREHS